MMKSWLIVTAVAASGLAAAPARAQAPTLVPAALRSVSPGGMRRGGAVDVVLDGVNIAAATEAVFDDPAITGAPTPGANRNQAKVRILLGPTAQLGIHRVYLRTPAGTTGAVTFAVGDWPEVSEREPNDTTGGGEVHPLPTTFLGTLDRVGDADTYRFQAAAGQELVFEVVANPIRSRLNSVLTLVDASDRVLAESAGVERQLDALLAYRVKEAGIYAIRIRDFENAFGADVTYRLNVGALPYATGVFPLGVARTGGYVTLRGYNLGSDAKVSIPPGAASPFTVRRTAGGELANSVRVAVGEAGDVPEQEATHNNAATAQALQVPVNVEGRVGAAGEADCYRFHAQKGRPLVLEVEARRLGSPLDSILEVLDAQGRRVERATLRSVAESAMTLSDRDSAATGLRFLTWSDFNVNDFVFIRGEVCQIIGLPKGPDDDVRFRNVKGARVGMLDTTPTGHAVNTPLYKVQVHPPATQFPPNGMPVFHLYYQNDDGGPLYGKDSHLTFTAPADGDYVVRLTDVRGEGSDRHAYRLTVRERRPDFRLTLNPEQPNVPAGASVPVEVAVDRLDDFSGPVDVHLEGLPAGITATPAQIEAGESTATLLLTAASGAATGAPVRLRVVGRARAGETELAHSFEPAGGESRLTVLPHADLVLTTKQQRLTLVPGQQQTIDASIVRQNGFAGRVPIDLKNLPFGVRVLDVGLNGVLITEQETARRFVVYCEPWVQPQQRLVYCTVRTETESPAPTEVAAAPITLEIASRTGRTAASK